MKEKDIRRYLKPSFLIRVAVYGLAGALLANGVCEVYQSNQPQKVSRGDVLLPLKIGGEWDVDRDWIKNNCGREGKLIGSDYPTKYQDTATIICRELSSKYLTP